MVRNRELENETFRLIFPHIFKDSFSLFKTDRRVMLELVFGRVFFGVMVKGSATNVYLTLNEGSPTSHPNNLK